MTKGFTVNYPHLDDKKIFSNKNNSPDKFSNTISGGVRGNIMDKRKTPGFLIVNSFINKYFLCDSGPEKEFEELVEILGSNFFNTSKFLELAKERLNEKKLQKDKKEGKKVRDSHHLNSVNNMGSQKIRYDNEEDNMQGGVCQYEYNNLYIYSQRGKISLPMVFKLRSKTNKSNQETNSKSNSSSNVIVRNSMAYLNEENCIFPKFKYSLFPSFVKEAFTDPSIQSNYFNEKDEKKGKEKKKIDVIISNKYNDFIINNGVGNSGDENEIEVGQDVLLNRIKEW
eukprot:CAMPEP_0170525264 /NCGR_PEP_ID=MMETSP0209-20121228/10739_1 /TAXON_ID=665100 ORGANISM="Litonotus pictus, Strain P1" /NCGR_SAMPLE_ID=MMETSP0209 /ASSEMBLY_ACC=CAM_ASM_000301 /LENGTH=282 /DNA_ID=CAMNT_0010814433 /DNA_START=1448 /DNA_END=2293 /DNA_ORIENTATION=+